MRRHNGPIRILVFHRALGFVHQSIPAAVTAIVGLADSNGFDVETTDDPGRFSDGSLRTYDAVVFVHTSGDVLPEQAQRQTLEDYLAGGGGFFAIHAASSMSDVAETWPWYRDLVGASFKGHTAAHLYCDEPLDESPGHRYTGPFDQAPADAELLGPAMAMVTWEPATIEVEDRDSPAARGLVDGETRVDEWYGFHENPRPHVHVVATVDETTYQPAQGAMGSDHPIVWWREFAGGRSVYNAMGHSAAAWADERFLAAVLGGIELAAGGVRIG